MARILVVDDIRMTQQIIEFALTKMGHEVMGTCSPVEVLELVRREMPDLLVLDYFMPGMDGVSLFSRLCAELGSQCPKVLFVTSAPYEMVVGGAESFGPVGHVSKPFRLGALRCAVAEALGGCSAMSVDEGVADRRTGENRGSPPQGL